MFHDLHWARGARCSCPMPRGALLRCSCSPVWARVMVSIRGRGEALSCPGNLCALCRRHSFPPSSLSWLSSRPPTPCHSLASSGVGTSLRWHSELATCYFPVHTASDTSNNFPEFKEGLSFTTSSAPHDSHVKMGRLRIIFLKRHLLGFIINSLLFSDITYLKKGFLVIDQCLIKLFRALYNLQHIITITKPRSRK